MEAGKPEPPELADRDIWSRIVLENALDAVIGVDQDDVVVDWNRQAELTFGWTRAEAIGSKLSELIIPPESREAHARGMERFLTTGVGPILNRRIELSGLHRAGHRFPVELTVLPVRRNDRWIFYSFLRDLTDKRRQEAELRASEARFRSFFDQSPFSTQLLSPDGRTLRVNRAWQELWRISDEVVENFILKEYNLLTDPQLEAKGALAYLRRGLAGEVTRIPPILYDPNELGKSGRARWVEGFVYPIKDAEGRLSQLLLVHEDVSEQVEARKKIVESEERFRLLVEGVSDYAIFMLDPSGKIDTWTSAAERIYGFTADEIVGTHFSALRSPEARAAGEPERELSIASAEGRHESEGDRVRKDGSRIRVSSVIAALREAGTLRGFSEITRDITELERTRQRLEEAIRARDEFISVCSHELKTPVTSLMLQFQMAQRQIDAGDPAAYSRTRVAMRTEMANRQLVRMSKLIEDMLDVSRAAMGRLKLEMAPLDLGALTGEVVERFSEQFQASRIAVDVEIGPEPVLVDGDKFRLEQVVANLLTNAMKYGARRPVRVAVCQSRGRARLEVEDHGIGIAKESLETVFERYERAIRSQHINGLGLGLFISKQIVESHKGHIHVESELGVGSTFIVELPLHGE